MSFAGHELHIGNMINTYKILMQKYEKAPLGRPKQEDNIKTDLQEIEHDDVNWIHLAQNGYPVVSC
jgi:hypothetical protein